MNTELIYLNDTYLLKDSAKLLNVGENENGHFAVFDRTIFYPQGGGQESDIGKIIITLDNGNRVQKSIHSVRFKQGLVMHYGDFSDLLHLNDCDILMEVDQQTRMRNSKLHSAGHLIASISEELDIGLRATKGFHFSNGSYVGFEIIIHKELDYQNLLKNINTRIKQCIVNGLEITDRITTLDELKKICSYVPSYLPEDKPLRIVTIENYQPIPCGGTHIKSFSQVKHIEVTKIKMKKGELKMSYVIE